MSSNIIFVGGPGRSGTSFVADRIGRHNEVATFQDVELKIFTEFGGLLDMQSVLTECFSPNRAEIIFRQFRNMFKSVRTGGYGQPALESLASVEYLNALEEEFYSRLQPEGYIDRLDYPTFNSAARDFLLELATIAMEQKPGSYYFLEKTPHNCLQPQFLHEIAPTARYLHIYRNPKATAVSLLNQTWGPKQLEHAIIWIQSYFSAWLKARAYFERLGLPLTDCRIEDICKNPRNLSEDICSHLGLANNDEMFAGASIEQLEGWKTKMPEEAYRLLDQKLDPLCEILGY